MAVLFPILQWFDTNGSMLANGQVYFYTANTTQLGTVYTDQGALTPLENPVQLNAYGRPATSGSIWINGSYRVVVVDSDGLTLYSANSVTGFNPVDWTTLTVTIAQLNAFKIDPGLRGLIVANNVVTVDANKNLALFGNITSNNYNATTSIKTPLINDSNGLSAITFSPVVSQVNALMLTPAATTAAPQLSATGSDTNIDLKFVSKSASKTIMLNSIKFPTADSTSGYGLQTSGNNVLSFSNMQCGRYKGTASTALAYSTTEDISPNGVSLMSAYTILFTVNITPTVSTSTLIITINLSGFSTGSSQLLGLLGTSLTSYPIAGGYNKILTTTGWANVHFRFIVPSVSTATRTYYIGASGIPDFFYVNYSNAVNPAFGGVSSSRVTVMEYVA